jgi:tetratricopeptide (TPR) repeat protein
MYGQGTETWPYGAKYVGQFKDDKFHGQGTYTYPDGRKYVGQIKDDKANGQGTFIWSDGAKYVGQWKDNYEHGQGIIYDANGMIEEQGYWENGKLISRKNISGSTSSSRSKGYIQVHEPAQNNKPQTAKTDNASTKYAQAYKYFKAGKLDEALSLFQAVVNLDPKNKGAYINMGIIYKRKKDYDNAILAYTKALNIDPNYYNAYFNRGLAYKQLGNTDRAINDFKKAVEVKPDSMDAKKQLSSLLKGKQSEIHSNIPRSKHENRNAIAVVIGNQRYAHTKNVEYALNDADAITRYLTKTFGYKKGNVFYIKNASKSDFELYFGNKDSYKGKLYNAIKEGKSDVFIYYSGHGAPGLKDSKGYLVPVEADPQYLELSGYPVDVFYKNLSEIPARSITVVLDACFSGATIFNNISPIVLEIDNPIINLKNAVVLSSSSGRQVSSWYNEKKHGMFTYFFLKAIHNKNADYNRDNRLTFKEVYRYISDKSEGVPYYARRMNGVEQNPTIEGNYKRKVLVQY